MAKGWAIGTEINGVPHFLTRENAFDKDADKAAIFDTERSAEAFVEFVTTPVTTIAYQLYELVKEGE